jgi:hypothetical protein
MPIHKSSPPVPILSQGPSLFDTRNAAECSHRNCCCTAKAPINQLPFLTKAMNSTKITNLVLRFSANDNKGYLVCRKKGMCYSNYHRNSAKCANTFELIPGKDVECSVTSIMKAVTECGPPFHLTFLKICLSKASLCFALSYPSREFKRQFPRRVFTEFRHKCKTECHLVKVEVTLRLTVSQSVSQYVLVSSTLVGLATRYYFLSDCCCLKFAVLYL